MEPPRNEEVWNVAEKLMTSLFEALRRIDTLAPEFPDELYEARDPETDMDVGDFINRLGEHSEIHRHELSAVRASIGAARPTDPGDTHPTTGEPYSRSWYRWWLLRAFMHRAEMVGELIGLTDADLDAKPSPEHTAGNGRSVREVCEHVLHVQGWLMGGVARGLSSARERDE
ncbi:hypothetical protein HN371_02400 [Candidatus Poribacteria bacterium]|jgi:hypothetical protein|nr:hypothetical protein [Candidatus Poribacteria bacterium]MBT5537007.1 hypothetical protein [Candidatus Poribacteria bacterium]MBT5711312.1 hypothetical protein [Candidatus Poribacteria bacterium]MBT7096945.1 hypothetical protein [Candidatus Poribacteria bacterium]MBT7804999.1 hypothetical protein [Candidatus Poribacteria bacterium]